MVKSLQKILDSAFGIAMAARSPQVATEAFQERERAFAERAKKIEALRQLRLTNPREEMSPMTFEVVRHRGHWRVLHGGQHSSSLSNQAHAIQAAKKEARAKRKLGHPVEVILRRTDGRSVAQSIDDNSRTKSSR